MGVDHLDAVPNIVIFIYDAVGDRDPEENRERGDTRSRDGGNRRFPVRSSMMLERTIELP